MPLPDELKHARAQRVSNWGRWGADDQRGTLNLIDAAAVRRGAAAVRRGVIVLALDPDGRGAGRRPGRDPRPDEPEAHDDCMSTSPFTGDPGDFTTSDDQVEMGLQAATHWDALAHAGYDGLLYNDTPTRCDHRATARRRLGIEHFGPIVTRGVLLDVARLKGVEWFDDAYAITGADLDAAERRRRASPSSPATSCSCAPDRCTGCARGDRDASAISAPGSVSTRSSGSTTTTSPPSPTTPSRSSSTRRENPAAMLPVHMIDLRDMGLMQGQLWDLDELAADCAADGVYEFLLAATPLPVTHAVGGLVAPTATK